MSQQTRKVLIVEDSRLVQKGYEIIFRSAGTNNVEIVAAFDGRQALDRLNEHPDCDLILLDINMPVLSGLEFLKIFRKQPAFADIPVIIISTEGEEDDIIRGLKAGANAYLTKPFEFNELHQLIERVLEKSVPPDRLERPAS